jgi:hypothetical protein
MYIPALGFIPYNRKMDKTLQDFCSVPCRATDSASTFVISSNWLFIFPFRSLQISAVEGRRQMGIRLASGRGWSETAVCITEPKPFLERHTVHTVKQVYLIISIKPAANVGECAGNATGVFTPYPNGCPLHWAGRFRSEAALSLSAVGAVPNAKREQGGELRLVPGLRQGVCEKYFFPSLPNEVPMLPNAS